MYEPDTLDGIRKFCEREGQPTSALDALYDSRPDTYEHIGQVRSLMRRAVCNLLARMDRHDASKLEQPELEAFDRMTPKLKVLKYGTPEYRASTDELGPALEHHYEVNDHHPQYYATGISGMSLLALLEMLCDWKAANMRTDPEHRIGFRQSMEINRERFGISTQLFSVLDKTAHELGWY